jgi:glycosyltransferase involved in cell wall biosynthesis
MVTLALEGGGPERDTVLLCNALAGKGARIALLVLRKRGPLRSLLDPAIQLIDVAQPRIRYAIFTMRRAIRALAPAVVIGSGIPSLNLVTLAAVRSLPRAHRPALVLREAAVPSMAHRDPSASNRAAYRILRHVYRYADHIITFTEAARRDLGRAFSVPTSMISALNTNAVLPPETVDQISRWDGEDDRESDLIVCVGRLSAEKDQRTLLRAMTLLPANRQWRLVIVGDGPERAVYETFVHENGLAHRVQFTGSVAEPLNWMRRASVAVCSSIYEGLGNAIIEALACGTPVVCTDCPYGPREILEGGRYGTLTPVGDAAAMAAAITAAFDRVPDRRLLMKRSLDFTAERTAARVLQIIAGLELKPTAARRLSGLVGVEVPTGAALQSNRAPS